MSITVRYFASLRDALGRDTEQLELAAGVDTVRAVWTQLQGDTPPPASTLVARNLEYAKWDDPVSDGDEIAFFPPVSGG